MALTCYNIEIRKAKWSSWMDLGIKDAPDGAKLMRIMASQPAGWDLLDYLMLGQPNL
jgi:hypothetical protein